MSRTARHKACFNSCP